MGTEVVAFRFVSFRFLLVHSGTVYRADQFHLHSFTVLSAQSIQVQIKYQISNTFLLHEYQKTNNITLSPQMDT